jgi:tetratricopeptide (TPR) repeat protein
MRGRFDEARRLTDEVRTIRRDIGFEVGAAMVSGEEDAYIAKLEGDLAAAERGERESIEILERLGERGYLSTLAAYHAHTLYGLGRLNEAFEETEVSEHASAPDDVWSQATWRGARAKVLARRGEFERAEALAREAVALTDGTDIVPLRAETLSALGEVLRLSGRVDEAADALKDALALYEQKGVPPLVERTRRLLVELNSRRPAAS